MLPPAAKVVPEGEHAINTARKARRKKTTDPALTMLAHDDRALRAFSYLPPSLQHAFIRCPR
jgi:hypothetical protein